MNAKEEDVKQATRALVANMLRIVAGEGKRGELTEQVSALKAAIDGVTGAPDGAFLMAQTLAEAAPHSPPWSDDGPPDPALVQAALRLTAARLARTPTQATKACRLMRDLVREGAER